MYDNGIVFDCPVFQKEKQDIAVEIVNQTTLLNYRGSAHVVAHIYTGWLLTQEVKENSDLILYAALEDGFNTNKPQKFHNDKVLSPDRKQYTNCYGLKSYLAFLPYLNRNDINDDEEDNNIDNKPHYFPVLCIENGNKDDYYYKTGKIFLKKAQDDDENSLFVLVKDENHEVRFTLDAKSFPDWVNEKFKDLCIEASRTDDWSDIDYFRSSQGCLSEQAHESNMLYYSLIEKVKFESGNKVAYLLRNVNCKEHDNKFHFPQVKQYAKRNCVQNLCEKTNNKVGFIALKQEGFDCSKEKPYFVANFPENTNDETIRKTVDQWLVNEHHYGDLTHAVSFSSNGRHGYGFIAVYVGGEFCKNIIFRKKTNSGYNVGRIFDKKNKNNLFGRMITSINIAISDIKPRKCFIKKIYDEDQQQCIGFYINTHYDKEPDKVSIVCLNDCSKDGVEDFIRNNGYCCGYTLGLTGLLVVVDANNAHKMPKIYNYYRDPLWIYCKYQPKSKRFIRCNEVDDYKIFNWLGYCQRLKSYVKKISSLEKENLTVNKLYSLKPSKPWYKTFRGWGLLLLAILIAGGGGALIGFFAPEIIAICAISVLATLSSIIAGAILGALFVIMTSIFAIAFKALLSCCCCCKDKQDGIKAMDDNYADDDELEQFIYDDKIYEQSCDRKEEEEKDNIIEVNKNNKNNRNQYTKTNSSTMYYYNHSNDNNNNMRTTCYDNNEEQLIME